jgi:tRNA (cytosine38-C5)-methyltransferase
MVRLIEILLKTGDQFLKFEQTDDLDVLRELRLRYFTPTELTRIFYLRPCGPGGKDVSNTDFLWPPTLSDKAKYRLIGNSVNVAVVAALIRHLVHEM